MIGRQTIDVTSESSRGWIPPRKTNTILLSQCYGDCIFAVPLMHSFYLHVFNFPHPRVFSIHCGSCSGSISGQPYISRIYGKMQFSKGNFYLPCRCITANIPCAFIKVIAQEGILAAVDRIHLMTALNGIAAGIAFCEF